MVNPQKIPDPDPIIKFLRVIWLGRMHMPEAVIGNIQASPTPKNVKEIQAL